MDVTEQILHNHLIYGPSDNTAPQGLAASKSLNFTDGGTIQKAEDQRVTIIPFTLQYQGTTGLHGAENYFVKVQTEISLDITLRCFEEPFWECAKFSTEAYDPASTYAAAVIDYDKDLTTINTYEPAKVVLSTRASTNSYISIDLTNLKTGNKYIDDWLDVRLYTSDREEHPYDKMYVRLRDYFYIGFHARNTRRLDYNVEALIGNELIAANDLEDTRYIARTTRCGAY